MVATKLGNTCERYVPIVPKRITVGLSASITFEIVNQAEYALGL